MFGAGGGFDEAPGVVEFGLEAGVFAFFVVLAAEDGEFGGFEGAGICEYALRCDIREQEERTIRRPRRLGARVSWSVYLL